MAPDQMPILRVMRKFTHRLQEINHQEVLVDPTIDDVPPLKVMARLSLDSK